MIGTRERSADTRGRCAIGLDVGGTKVAAGVVTVDGCVLESVVTPTPNGDDGAEVLNTMLRLVDELRTRQPHVEAIGVGAAGMVDWPNGRIRWAPNNTYRDFPLRELLACNTGLPAVVENDANAAAWAEARLGAGSGHDDVVILTIGTGIGGGIIRGGTLQRGRTGIGGEVGHLIINPHQGDRCACGVIGCLEAMASGTALGHAGRVAAAADPTGRLAALAGGAHKVTGETVYRAARDGDLTARELFDQLGYWLGAGIASLVNLLDPELVILTGGLITTGDLLLIPTRASYEQFVFGRAHRALPPIVPAELGTEAGLIGAALLALDNCSDIEPSHGAKKHKRQHDRVRRGRDGKGCTST